MAPRVKRSEENADAAGKVTLQDHVTGETYDYADVDSAEGAYPAINKRHRERGFSGNFTIVDASGNVLSKNGVRT